MGTRTNEGGSGGSASEYRIGAVAQLTGLSTDTIRAWERRYALVEPTRTETGLRVYSLNDVQRLRLVKELRDQGESVAALAKLGLDELEARFSTAQDITREQEGGSEPLPLSILDPVVSGQLQQGGYEDELFDSHQSFDELGSLVDALERSVSTPRLIVVRLSHLGDAPLERLEGLLALPPSGGVVVTYNFASSRLLRKIRALGAEPLQTPVDIHTLARAIRIAVNIPQRRERPLTLPQPAGVGENAPPLFSESQLGRLRQLESALDCECPQHLSSIVLGLQAFERYSARCEDEDPREAAVHRALYEQTGEARVIMERALRMLCDHENIEI